MTRVLFYRPVRTGRLAVTTADAVHGVRFFVHGNVQFANFLTGFASAAFFAVDFEAVERDFVEDAVNRSERADIAAERAVNYHRRNQRDCEDCKFPAEDEARSPPHRIVQKNEGNSAFQSAHRANPLAEPGLAKTGDVNHEHRE